MSEESRAINIECRVTIKARGVTRTLCWRNYSGVIPAQRSAQGIQHVPQVRNKPKGLLTLGREAVPQFNRQH